jgi:hypothetical protein
MMLSDGESTLRILAKVTIKIRAICIHPGLPRL